MKITRLVSIGLCCVLSASSFAHEPVTSEVPLFELIGAYSSTHGAKIIVKPSLNRTVKIDGDYPTTIGTTAFLEILTCSGLVALERDGLVFIMSVEDSVTRGDDFEGHWRG